MRYEYYTMTMNKPSNIAYDGHMYILAVRIQKTIMFRSCHLLSVARVAIDTNVIKFAEMQNIAANDTNTQSTMSVAPSSTVYFCDL